MEEFPDWWRGTRPPAAYDGERPVLEGGLFRLDPEVLPVWEGLRMLRFWRARGRGLEVDVSDLLLTVSWSEFDACTFRQRASGPVRNAHGNSAQGSFGHRPSVYRNCTFDRVRFKNAGAFGLGQARFEGCTFVHCRWEGSRAFEADLLRCRFVGRMNGCVWFGGHSRDGRFRRNEIHGNDFTEVRFADNVGWRDDFPSALQAYPEAYAPVART